MLDYLGQGLLLAGDISGLNAGPMHAVDEYTSRRQPRACWWCWINTSMVPLRAAEHAALVYARFRLSHQMDSLFGVFTRKLGNATFVVVEES